MRRYCQYTHRLAAVTAYALVKSCTNRDLEPSVVVSAGQRGQPGTLEHSVDADVAQAVQAVAETSAAAKRPVAALVAPPAGTPVPPADVPVVGAVPDGTAVATAPDATALLGPLKGLLGEAPAEDPLVARAREVEKRGRVGLVATRLEVAPDLARVTVESTLWVRLGAVRK